MKSEANNQPKPSSNIDGLAGIRTSDGTRLDELIGPPTFAKINAHFLSIAEGIIQAKEKEIISRYEDETDDEVKAANAQHDYVRFHLAELRTAFHKAFNQGEE